ncbi:MAG: hypothetical protein M1486_07140, partial [Gammaproteobacteria bacterium]|nr:hypothetical protein [Gammaproteobacteria bacterium]
MRKLLIIAVFLMLLLPNTVYATTLPDGVPYSIIVNGKTLDFNENIARDKGYVVYGTYADVPGNEEKQGQYRYLGYDLNRNPFSNKDFPNDADSGRAAYQKSWIQYPWDEGLCKQPIYNKNPKASQWLDTLNWPGWPGTKLKDYLKIQSAPSEYTPGSAEGWHEGGGVWYQTFELDPEKKVTLLEQPVVPTPTPVENTTAWVDGCFWDMPQQEGDTFTTYVIRASRASNNINTKIHIRIYMFGPTGYKNTPGTTISGCDMPPDSVPKKLILDEDMFFTEKDPVYVKKLSFPVPTEIGSAYGLFVQTGDDISNNTGVVCSAQLWAEDSMHHTSHTLSSTKIFPWINW